MKRVYTKIGDVFEVPIDAETKKYFQYIANDISQLNSDVIRAFPRTYSAEETSVVEDVVSEGVEFHAHCIVPLGVKLGLWRKVGRTSDVGPLDALFRCTNDSGCKPGEQVLVSHRWYVWRINEEFRRVGELKGENRNAEIGVVVNPYDIVHRMKNGGYDFFYPGFE